MSVKFTDGDSSNVEYVNGDVISHGINLSKLFIDKENIEFIGVDYQGDGIIDFHFDQMGTGGCLVATLTYEVENASYYLMMQTSETNEDDFSTHFEGSQQQVKVLTVAIPNEIKPCFTDGVFDLDKWSDARYAYNGSKVSP